MKYRPLLPLRQLLIILAVLAILTKTPNQAAAAAPHVYVVLWFDTEDYILPASDDAALHVAEFLSREHIRATFKVVGEKARTLERRGRTDVIAALKKHEIGYHSNFHSVPPSPAMYCADLGWEEGVVEFDRREGAGRQDVQRIFGSAPSCYGQPGSSWSPQAYGAMRKWGMPVYLDSGRHVNMEGKPCYYCGVLNLYKLDFTLRADLNHPAAIKEAEDKLFAAREKLLAEKGGIVSIFYHPCEFVHKQFWDAANFLNGANPARERWQLPAAKNPEETKISYEIFENYIHFIQRFPDVRFVTASEVARIYADRSRKRSFSPQEINTLAKAVTEDIGFYHTADYNLAASEVFLLLSEYTAAHVGGRHPMAIQLTRSPFGPSEKETVMAAPVTTDWSQFSRTVVDVASYLSRHGKIPNTVWLGSQGVSPEAYMLTLARVTSDLIEGRDISQVLQVRPARLFATRYVADDAANLWGWVIFPRGFKAPAMMELARRQAWTLKPAILDPTSN